LRFKTGNICWRDEIIGPKCISGKYFEYNFEENTYSDFGGNGYELIIQASNESKAQQALELFIAALTLVEGHTIYLVSDIPAVFDYTKRKQSVELIPAKSNLHLHSQSGIYAAARIAAKASNRKIYSNSLYKYFFACSQQSNYSIDLSPFHGEYQKLTRNPLDHIRYGYAILAHYSVIEELGLEIRASNKNPSKLGGDWNPRVKQDLETRLSKSRVNLSKRAFWNLRSRPTRVHPKEKLVLAGRASWAKYSVRDSTIEIIDAISYLSWLRSKIIAHKLHDSYMSISIYDVANANSLVRQLLFDILGNQFLTQ
jgi:hypothetical protein